ncbi:MAG: zinc ribbon domain-containing protein [Candidatus Omnitrophica bacterium]|nr:zinc ribbon domain-containing protein [Candidatus Omnitrophota bacterium]
MPTYEYECTKCGHRFEKFQKMTDKPVSKCPECKGKVKRLIGLGGGVIFKGAGFYTTEYRSEEYKRREREEKAGITAGSSTGKSSSCSSCSSSSCSTCGK